MIFVLIISRDLLQRHYATYHEIRDPSLPPPTNIPAVAGRTPIACLNCASAKTGCDKRVPCSRCADKSLPCAARFARRSSKLVARAIAASEASDRAAEQTATQVVKSTPFNDQRQQEHIDPQLQHTTAQIVAVGENSADRSANADEFDDFMEYNYALGSPGINYQELLAWNDNGFNYSYQELLTWDDFPVDLGICGDQYLPADGHHG